MESVIRSVSESQDEILSAIRRLHCPEGFECDLTYGNGVFWKHIPCPPYRFDISPQKEGVIQSCSTAIPLPDEYLSNCVFDPPFLTYIRKGREHSGGKCIMSQRFSGYWTYKELEEHYKKTLIEVRRVLKKKGKMVFKCQDIIHNHRMHPTHVNVIGWAEERGFRLCDLFVLTAKHRLPTRAAPHGRQTQKHARIFHSYFLVLEKI